jgi:uncharacterized protein (TIGR03437 family)
MKSQSIAVLCFLASPIFIQAQQPGYQPSFQVSTIADGCPTQSDPAASLLVGDFNGDHIPDLAVGCGPISSNGFTQIAVLLGRGDGSFQPAAFTSLAAAPAFNNSQETEWGVIFVADINGDGKSDFVYSSLGSSISYAPNRSGPSCTVTVLLSNGDGTFAPPKNLASGLTYCVWGTADLNGDGIPDLILESKALAGFEVMSGKGDGTFATATQFSAPSTVPLTSGDFNGDGMPDLITLGPSNSISIWLNQGGGSFAMPAQIATLTGGVVEVLAGDYNGDGKLDLAVATGCSACLGSQLYVFPGNGDGTFQPSNPVLNISNAPLVGMDLNGDGRMDLAQQFEPQDAIILVLVGVSHSSRAIPSRSQQSDPMQPYDGAGVGFYLGTANGSLQGLPPVNLPRPLVSVDFNGDGKPDMAGLDGTLDEVTVMINTPGAATANWALKSPMVNPPPRSNHAMAFDSAHSQVVMFGGLGDSNQFLADTWLWDGANWTASAPQSSPAARIGHAMAYDSVHGQVVLFGGYNGSSAVNDTWLWDGTQWSQASPQTSPPPRVYSAMAFDSTRGNVVLFGGETGASNGDALGDTWLWDGYNWSEQTPLNAPAAQYSHAMAYDSATSQTVLLEGVGQGGDVLYDSMWVWNGVNWTPGTQPVLPPRFARAMAYDSGHGQLVVFGGYGVTNHPLIDTWTSDGTIWTDQFTPASPTPRGDDLMVYDIAHNQVVLFGGRTENAFFTDLVTLGDTWTWNGGTSISAVVSASAFGGFSSVAPGSWVEIYGSNLAPGMRPWGGSDFTGGNAPTSLDSVSVNIGGQPAFVDYISSNQVNAQLPSNIPTGGTLPVQVTNGGAISAPFNINVQATEPGLLAPASFKVSGKQYVVAQLSDGSYVLPAGAIQGVSSRPAKPGETVVMYGVGFGPVTPEIPAGQIVTQSNQLAAPIQILFGSTPAQLSYAGLAPNLVGLYQFNVVVPPVADSNLVPLTFQLGGAAGSQSLYTAVQH